MKQLISTSFLIASVILYSLFSCKHYEVPDEVDLVLNQAGNNRGNLDDVLKHYSRSKKDSLKYQAACYLIMNMPGHYGIYHHNLDAPDAIFENIERTLQSDEIPAFLRAGEVKEVENNAYQRYDIEVITSDFLISHIDNAFDAWENYPWCKDMSFEDFKTYILPYRFDEEPLTDMRAFFMKKYAWLVDSMMGFTDMTRAFTLVYKNFYQLPDKQGGWEYGEIQNMYDVVRLSKGLCPHETLLKSTIMRSLGIVCTYDEIPHWANRNSNHAWNAYLDEKDNPLIIDGDDSLRRHFYLHSAEFPVEEPSDSLLPSYLSVMAVKKAPKVFRKTYAANSKDLIFSNPTGENIPDEFKNIFYQDVSASYLSCFDVSHSITGNIDKSFFYLCIFEPGNLVPVFCGKINNGNMFFENMGSDVLYFPAIFHEDQIYPVGKPFILEKDGVIREISAHTTKKQTLVAYRKYPLFMNILNYSNYMYQGRFQGSNREDFTDAEDLYTIKKTFILPTEVPVFNQKKFRYLRYLPDSTNGGDIGELVFYYDSIGIALPLKGKLICRYEGPTKSNYTYAFDGKLDTYYESIDYGTWIGMDLGQGNAKRVTKIKFCPRTDTNFIIPGNEYELFYWNNGWESLGRKIATDHILVYNDVPEGALFWLHCHSGGQEERPFTYEEGKQIWW